MTFKTSLRRLRVNQYCFIEFPLRKAFYVCKVLLQNSEVVFVHFLRFHIKSKSPFNCLFFLLLLRFHNRCSSKDHMYSYTSDRPFICEFCDESFSQKSKMEEHRRVHTDKKPYFCELCDLRSVYVCIYILYIIIYIFFFFSFLFFFVRCQYLDFYYYHYLLQYEILAVLLLVN